MAYFDGIAEYGWAELMGDVSGGIVAALLALPYGLAMSSLMGLPPALGVFTSILTAPVTAALGRNPILIGGAASATIPFVAAAVRQQGVSGAAKFSIAASAITLGLAAAGIGRRMARVPQFVVTGFSCVMGLLMIVSQLDVMLGIDGPPGGWRLASLLLGLSVLAGAWLAGRWSPKVPAPLLGVLLAVAIARLCGMHEREIGSLPAGWPTLSGLSWTAEDVVSVLPPAFALAVVSSVNTMLNARMVEHLRTGKPAAGTRDADLELRAYGIANLVAGMFGAPPSVGFAGRSLAVIRCGGSTRVANLTHALVLGIILWLGSSFVSHIPMAALAGVTVWTGFCLVEGSLTPGLGLHSQHTLRKEKPYEFYRDSTNYPKTT